MASIDTIQRAIDLSRKVHSVFIATSSSQRIPHVAAAGPLELQAPERVVVTAWFCPKTIKNLASNKSMAIVVFDYKNDTGYQIVGRVERISEIAVLNGYAPETEKTHVYPQVKQRLIVEVAQVLLFSVAPHGDVDA